MYCGTVSILTKVLLQDYWPFQSNRVFIEVFKFAQEYRFEKPVIGIFYETNYSPIDTKKNYYFPLAQLSKSISPNLISWIVAPAGKFFGRRGFSVVISEWNSLCFGILFVWCCENTDTTFDKKSTFQQLYCHKRWLDSLYPSWSARTQNSWLCLPNCNHGSVSRPKRLQPLNIFIVNLNIIHNCRDDFLHQVRTLKVSELWEISFWDISCPLKNGKTEAIVLPRKFLIRTYLDFDKRVSPWLLTDSIRQGPNQNVYL